MKHVWILNHYAAPPGYAAGTRHYALASHIAKHGWRSTILAATTDHKTGGQRIAALQACTRQEYSGVTFGWLRVPEYRGNGWRRALNMIMYAVRALISPIAAAVGAPTVIVGSSVHPLAAVAGYLLARRYRVPFVFEVRDLWPQTLVDMGRLRDDGIVTRALRAIERRLYAVADKIIAVPPLAADYIGPTGVAASKITVIPNGAEIDGPARPLRQDRYEQFDVMYFGAHGAANGLDNVLRAMSVLQARGDERIRLRLIGDGPAKASLMQLAAELRLLNVTFEPAVPKSEIPRMAAEADAFVFNLMDLAVFRYGISSNKLFDFLAAGRPIVFCCTAGNDPVAEARAGLSVRPNDPDALADALTRMSALPHAERQAMAERGRAFVEENHSFRMLGERFAGVLDDVLRAHGAR